MLGIAECYCVYYWFVHSAKFRTLSVFEDIAIGKYLNYKYYQITVETHQIYLYV